MLDSSLNKYVTGVQVLEALDIPAKPVLPTVATCPFCSQFRLQCYNDDVCGGSWVYCRGCGAYGDMIELSAAVWKLEIPSTLRKMMQRGLGIPAAALSGQGIDNYIEHHVERRKRMTAFWGECQRRALRSSDPGIMALQRELGIMNHLDTASWMLHGGQILGVASRDEIDRCCRPGTLTRRNLIPEPTPGHRGRNRGGQGLLRGRQWSQALVVPYFDVPGRISGFLFIGQTNDLQKDYLFYPTCSAFSRPKVLEAGLGMLPMALQGPHEELGDTLFVFGSPWQALRLQLRHLRDHTRPLPVVIAHQAMTARTQLPWRWLPYAQRTCWTSALTPQTIRLARTGDLSVGTYVAPHGLELSSSFQCLDLLKNIRATAKPWPTALRGMLRGLDPARAEDVLRDVELEGPALREFVDGCDEPLQERLKGCTQHLTQHVTVDGRRYMEQYDRWFEVKKKHSKDERDVEIEVCDGIVVIEQILYTNNKSYYKGYVRHKGRNFPFTEQAKRLDGRLLTWAREHLRAHGGKHLAFAPRLDTHSINLAIALRPPVTAPGAAAVGWDAGHRAFLFPRYLVTDQGRVETGHVCLFDEDQAPCGDFRPARPVPRAVVRTLDNVNDETRLFWATAAAVLQAAIAPQANQAAQNVYLEGRGAQWVGNTLLAHAGCQTAATTLEAEAQLRAHCWPVYLAQRLDWAVSQWTVTRQPHGVFLGASPAQARILEMRPGWLGIVLDNPLGSAQVTNSFGSHVLPAYLQDLCERRLWLPGTGQTLLANVLDDLAEWFQRLGGHGTSVLAAGDVLRLAPPGWQSFLRLVLLLRERGYMPSGVPTHETGHAAIVVREDHTVWISQARFSDAAHQEAGFPPDLLLVTRALQDAGALLAESVYRGERGWVVPEPWWTTHYHETLSLMTEVTHEQQMHVPAAH